LGLPAKASDFWQTPSDVRSLLSSPFANGVVGCFTITTGASGIRLSPLQKLLYPRHDRRFQRRHVRIDALVVCVGRASLGYPLNFAPAKTHLFAPMESAEGGERFNIEGTANRSRSTRSYYQELADPITDDELNYWSSQCPCRLRRIGGVCLKIVVCFLLTIRGYLKPNPPSVRLPLGPRRDPQREF